MPTYEYRCKACDHGFEIVQSFSDDALETCPECGGSLKKVYGNVGIAFKGNGFYKNDHGSRAKPSAGSSSKESSSKDSSSKESSSSDSSSSSTTSSTSEKATTSTSSSAD